MNKQKRRRLYSFQQNDNAVDTLVTLSMCWSCTDIVQESKTKSNVTTGCAVAQHL